MCTRYISPEAADIERLWHVGAGHPWRGGDLFPNYQGPFIRAARDVPEPARELVVGQWSLIPWFAKERKLRFPTSNARSEELADKASYKHPWARGQRCIIPALAFFEPNWESGKHVPWMFRRTDGLPWGLAGGLNPGNVADAVRITAAPLVDTSSGVESAPGVKDDARIAAFCAAARSA